MEQDNIGFENQIFTWEEWDKGPGALSAIFYDITLVVPVGQFKVGTFFPKAAIDGENSRLYLLTEDKEYTFRLVIKAEVL